MNNIIEYAILLGLFFFVMCAFGWAFYEVLHQLQIMQELATRIPLI